MPNGRAGGWWVTIRTGHEAGPAWRAAGRSPGSGPYTAVDSVRRSEGEMRVLVIGAGLLGSAAAYELAARGASVTVLEAAEPGGGASGHSFAWVNAQNKAPESYYTLNADGVAAYGALREAFGADGWWHDGGDLVVRPAAQGEALDAAVAAMTARGYAARRLDRAQVVELEPDLAIADDATAAWYPDEGWIETRPLIARLLGAVRARGGQVERGTPVDRLERDGARVTGARLADGRAVPADLVVLAAGTSSAALAASAGAGFSMAPSPGLLTVLTPAASGPRRVVHAAGLTLRPDGGGRTIIASRPLDAELEPDLSAMAVDDPRCLDVREAAIRLYPGLGSTTVESARIGRRSVATDGMPLVGRTPAVEGLYLLVSHSGVTLAALLGRLAAEDILGSAPTALEPYRPDRFTSG